MPRVHPRQYCRICARHRDEVGDLSTRGKCQECATAMVAANITHLEAHNGVFFDHWRRRTVAAFGAVFPDDLEKVG